MRHVWSVSQKLTGAEMVDQPKSVFVSMGNPYRKEYELLLDSLMEILQEAGLRPRVINRTDYPIGRPLNHIVDVMSECSGVIIVAFERKFFPNGTEKRGSKSQKELTNGRFTTPWNHIEAALAFNKGLPLLVLAEDGVQQEGLIDEGHEWYVERFTLDEEPLASKRIRQRIQEWSRFVRDGKSATSPLKKFSHETTIREIIEHMSVKSIWGSLSALGGLVVAIFGLGFAAGKYFSGH